MHHMLLLAVCLTTFGLASGAATPPNVVLAVVDDLGWNDVGWHDQFNQIKTPKLNQLVKEEAIELTNYYVYRFCSPTRSTFMTGRYPWHIGQQTNMNLNPTPGIACGINLAYDFLPKVLKQKGYATWALGKWHLGFLTNQFTPTGRGFDHYLGYYSGAEEHFTHLKSGLGLNKYDLSNNTGDDIKPCLGSVGNASATYSSYLYGNETLRLLAAHDETVPLFIYLAWNNVHSPCEAPDNYLAVNTDIQNKPRQALAGMMSALDDQLTDVIGGFKNKGIWDNTIFIFTTDNGGNLGGDGINFPLRGGKYTFWQGGCRGNSFITGGLVPQALRGSKWNGMAHAADWYTSIAAVAGASVASSGPKPADGVVLFDAIFSNATSTRTEVVLQIESNNAENDYILPDADYCAANPSEVPHCNPPGGAEMETRTTHIYSAASNQGKQQQQQQQQPQTNKQTSPDPTPPRPYPMIVACDKTDPNQQYTLNAEYAGSLCLGSAASGSGCFNVQKSASRIITFKGDDKANGVFFFDAGMLKSNLTGAAAGSKEVGAAGDNRECVLAGGVGEQLVLGSCSSPGAKSWTYSPSTFQIKFTPAPSTTATATTAAAASIATGCVANHPIPALPTELKCGVLIQGDYKYIQGYPGWTNDAWNGWPTAPTDADESVRDAALSLARVGGNSTFCEDSPCLFNIATDPTEHNDISAAHPDIIATMKARVLVLLQGEVTMAASGLCPTPTGSGPDQKSHQMAEMLGFWTPWLPPLPSPSPLV